MRALVVGATAGVGEALANRLAERGDSVVLVGRDAADLERVAAHVRSRWGAHADVIVADASRPTEMANTLRALVGHQSFDVALFPVGVSVEGDSVRAVTDIGADLIATNLVAVMMASSVVAEAMRARGYGEVVGFTSIAAARGRPRNAAYAAAKRGLDSWFESLRADLAPDEVVVRWYELGYVRTNLSFGQAMPLPAAEPGDIAARVLRDLGHRGGRFYAPRWWGPVTTVLRLLPFSIVRRLKT